MAVDDPTPHDLVEVVADQQDGSCGRRPGAGVLVYGLMQPAGRPGARGELLATPLVSVYDPRSKVIPPASMLPFHEAAANPHKLLLRYEGDVGVNLQHVGVLVGRNAHARLWPAIFDWLDAPELDRLPAAA